MTDSRFPLRLNAAVALLDEHRQRRPDHPAVICGSTVLTYGELAAAVDRCGNVLRGLGVRMEERVALLLPDSAECVVAFLAAIKIGAVAIPMNTLLTAADYEYMLGDSRARVLIVHADWLDRIEPIRSRLPHLAAVLVVGGTGENDFASHLANADAELTPADTHRDDMAFWLYSSGTTGKPKAAVHLQHDMLYAADAYAVATLGLHADDVSFSVAKLFFAYGLGNGLYFPLRTGGTTVLLPERPTPEHVFDVIDRFQPTVFYSVPTSYVALLHHAEKQGRTSLGRVRMCVSAGETLPRHLFEKWRERFGLEILDGIGSTEILHIFIANPPGAARPGSTGRLVPGYEAKIVDDDGVELPPGQVGTLMIRGDSIAAGYWN